MVLELQNRTLSFGHNAMLRNVRLTAETGSCVAVAPGMAQRRGAAAGN